jgi:hypothetical protein
MKRSLRLSEMTNLVLLLSVDTSRQPRTTLLGPAAISKSDRPTRLELSMAMALDKTRELMVG